MKKVLSHVLHTAISLAVMACSAPAPVEASPGFGTNPGMRSPSSAVKSGPFQVPAGLRGRVDFWKAIFSKYGRHQALVHHRDYPQVIFDVLDFNEYTTGMDARSYSRMRAEIEQRSIESIKSALRVLATGADPSSAVEHTVEEAMRKLPGGREKYQKALDNDLVRTQTGIRERYMEAVRRAGRYLPVMEQVFVTEYGLPKELTRLPFIESSFDYTAYSSVGAAGMWQFMPRTGKAHGLAVGRYVDERRDPIKSTRAAAEYLRTAYNSLGSWGLAVTSYNHGVAGVRNKVAKAGTTDITKIIEHPDERYLGFASSNFFPEFLAAVEIYANHEAYFPGLVLDPPVHFASRRLPSATSAQYLAKQLGVDLMDLREVNYAILEPVWRGKAKIPAGYMLRVPLDSNQRLANLELREPEVRTVAPAASSVYGGGISYKVRKGDTLASIAKKYRTSVAALVKLNSLKTQMLRIGQTLTVKNQEQPAAKRHVQQNAPVLKPKTPAKTTAKKPSKPKVIAKKPKVVAAKPKSKKGK